MSTTLTLVQTMKNTKKILVSNVGDIKLSKCILVDRRQKTSKISKISNTSSRNDGLEDTSPYTNPHQSTFPQTNGVPPKTAALLYQQCHQRLRDRDCCVWEACSQTKPNGMQRAEWAMLHGCPPRERGARL